MLRIFRAIYFCSLTPTLSLSLSPTNLGNRNPSKTHELCVETNRFKQPMSLSAPHPAKPERPIPGRPRFIQADGKVSHQVSLQKQLKICYCVLAPLWWNTSNSNAKTIRKSEDSPGMSHDEPPFSQAPRRARPTPSLYLAWRGPTKRGTKEHLQPQRQGFLWRTSWTIMFNFFYIIPYIALHV